MAIDRKDLHDLIDEIAPEDVDTVRKILKALRSQHVHDEWEFDDSPLTEEDAGAMAELIADFDADPEIRQMIAESEQDIEKGHVYTTQQVIEMIKNGEI